MRARRIAVVLAVLAAVVPLLAEPAGADVRFVEVSLPTGSNPAGIVTGPDGNLWVAAGNAQAILRVTRAGAVTSFATGGFPYEIVVGPDGNLWFTQTQGNRIVRMTTDGAMTEFPGSSQPTALPRGITVGADGNLWVAVITPSSATKGSILRVTPAGQVSEFVLPTAFARAEGITLGPDGNVWFTEHVIDGVGRITPAGAITEFPTGGGADRHPFAIATGRDGNLWVTEANSGDLVRMTPAGAFTRFPAGTERSGPLSIVPGPDGELWFAQSEGNRLARVDASGQVTEYPIGPRYAEYTVQDITVGPEGDLWLSAPIKGALIHASFEHIVSSAGSPVDAAVTRIAGTDRIATAIAASHVGRPTGGAPAAVLVRSDSYADALAGGPLAVARRGSLLLTPPDALPAVVRDELRRLVVPGGTVLVLGGERAVSSAVAGAVTALGFQVQRLAGADRYATAVAVANAIGSPSRFLLADGNAFGEALSAGAAAAALGGALLLTNGSTVPVSVRDHLASHPGTARLAVGAAAAAAVPGDAVVGSDRYDTSARLAARLFPSAQRFGLANGDSFPDALSSAAVLGPAGSPLLLTPGGSLAPSVRSWLADHRQVLKTGTTFGGTGVVSESVRRAAGAALTG